MNVKTLDTDQIIDMIERDFPGWDWLMRSNVRTELDSTGSVERYFVNLMSPEFESRVLQTEKGFIDVSAGIRFNAYGASRSAALGEAYGKAMDWVADQAAKHDS